MSFSSVKVRATFSGAPAVHSPRKVIMSVSQSCSTQPTRAVRYAEEAAGGSLNGWIRKQLLVASDEVLLTLDVHLVDVQLVLRVGKHCNVGGEHAATLKESAGSARQHLLPGTAVRS